MWAEEVEKCAQKKLKIWTEKAEKRALRGINTLGRFSLIFFFFFFFFFYIGDNLCNFMFAFLHTKPVLKIGSTV